MSCAPCYWALVALALLAALLAGNSQPARRLPVYDAIPRPAVSKWQLYGAVFLLTLYTIVAHGGSLGIWPSNTLFAWQNSVRMGADVLEMDTRMTKDGEIVCIHDQTVARTTGAGDSNVHDLTLRELQALDAGYTHGSAKREALLPGEMANASDSFPFRGLGIRVPTLRQVFQRFPAIPKVIEMKAIAGTGVPDEHVTRLCALLQQYGQQHKVIIATFDVNAFARFRQVCPAVSTSPELYNVLLFFAASLLGLERLLSPSYEALHVPVEFNGIPLLSQRFIQAAHNLNLQVHPWTVNLPEQQAQVLAWGADGIMTDRIDLLLLRLRRLDEAEVVTDAKVQQVATGEACSMAAQALLQSSAGCDLLKERD